MQAHLSGKIIPARRKTILAVGLLMAAVIALFDRFLARDVSIGILYVLPITVLALVLSRWQILACAVLAAFLREYLGPAAWTEDTPTRWILALVAFSGVGLVLRGLVDSQRQRLEYEKTLKESAAARRNAEDAAFAILEGSPAAVITAGADGRIELVNGAAKRLLGLEGEGAAGEPIGNYFPMLDKLLKKSSHGPLIGSMLEGVGHRRNGETYLAQMWVSRYETPFGLKLTIVFTDASEQLRDREELGLRQLLMHSRILVAAVSHEIRNLAAAADALHANLGRSREVAANEDFIGLGRLISGLRKLSSDQLPASPEQAFADVEVDALLRDLNIILQTAAETANTKVVWEIPASLPPLRVDHSALLQVLLNLTRNSMRALQGQPEACMRIAAYQMDGSVLLNVFDNGPGIEAPERLFYPFQAGATATGLGLYVSRAIVRTYGGDLHYVRRVKESGFVIQLPATSDAPAAHV